MANFWTDLAMKSFNGEDVATAIYHTLLRPNRWYTGNSIKTWIMDNIFLPNLGITPGQQMQTSRWSAYCHFNQEASFDNLLQKIKQRFGDFGKNGSTVLVHPLLPVPLVQTLINSGVDPVFFDMDKNTLSWNVDQPESLHFGPSFLVLSCINGLAHTILPVLDWAFGRKIPVLLYLGSSDLTVEVLYAASHPGATAVLYNAGLNWIELALPPVNFLDLEQKEWYISWFLEDRIVSAQEEHLKDSQEQYGSFLEKMHYLLINDGKSKLGSQLLGVLSKKLIYKQKISGTIDQIQESIRQDWEKIERAALPDLFFDLKMSRDVDTALAKTDIFVQRCLEKQTRVREIYQLLVGQVEKMPAGSVEIPPCYVDLVYTRFHFYTTDLNHWLPIFRSYNLKFKLFKIHDRVLQDSNLPNAALAASYGVLIEV